MKPTTSLIISTYNRPHALRLCLESVKSQTILPAEIIIADDGSADETKTLIDQYAAAFSIPLKHVWQPDNGYQLAQIRNKAFAAATGEYIIQTDGDLVFHKHFVKDHLSISKHGTFVSGARALINEQATKELLDRSHYSSLQIQNSVLGKRYNAVHSKILSSFNYLFQRGVGHVEYVLGCNMAFWKEDLIKVNGYNEEFTGWGKEDNDISIRLINAGVKLRFLKFGGIVYHLHHNERPLSRVSINEKIFKKSRTNKLKFVTKGMDQYSNSISSNEET